MSKHWQLEKPQNDVNKIPTYAPGTPERAQLLKEIEALKRTTEEIPLIINGEPVKTGQTVDVVCPHDHKRVLARAHLAGEPELRRAIDAALEAHKTWSTMDGYDRAAIFMRAADLLAGPRRIQNIAAIMLNQSKTPFEAEIDLAELVDFWRFNAYYMQFLYEQQPDQISGEINRFDWRPLEGFVLAVPPFNFYSIGGNLPYSAGSGGQRCPLEARTIGAALELSHHANTDRSGATQGGY
jgi:1-pyrroline-5-carboxylate dehydrogenase